MTPEQRTLLERAAKAAGYWILEPYRKGELRVCKPNDTYNSFRFNPITDHGDRYRLMNTCGLAVHNSGRVYRYTTNSYGDRRWLQITDFTHGDDESEGWAVVRAAAATLRDDKD